MTRQDPSSATRPFWAATPPRTIRRGHFWVPGERVERDGKTYQRGPMFADWEAPEQVTRPYPIVLVHGGGFQGTEWLDTPDGRPGWAQRLVEAGYATVIVDRPGHGRSPLHTDIVGLMGPPFSYEGYRQIYFPPDPSGKHTQWPFAPDDVESMDQFIAGYGPLPADLAVSEDMDADRLARLLDRIGPAILLTHSASGPSGWLAANRRPGLVRAIVSVEPMGPPFADIPNIGPLRWGLTAAPLTFDPPRASPEAVREANPGALRLANLVDLPIAVVTGDTSAFAPASPPIVAALKAGGAAAELRRYRQRPRADLREKLGRGAATGAHLAGAPRRHNANVRRRMMEVGFSTESEHAMDEREWTRRNVIVSSLAGGAAMVAGLPETPARGATPEPVDEPRRKLDVVLTINDAKHRLADLDAHTTLLDALRDYLQLTGSKKGCALGACGACTVLVDGRRVNSCLTLAVMSQGKAITTIEGLAQDGKLHPLQAAFVAHDGYQCGYCTPGQIMSGVACIAEGHTHADDEIREWMSGNICRCGAYTNIVAAIHDVAGQED